MSPRRACQRHKAADRRRFDPGSVAGRDRHRYARSAMTSAIASSIRGLSGLLLAAALACCGAARRRRAPTPRGPTPRPPRAGRRRVRKRASQNLARRALRRGAAFQPAVRDRPGRKTDYDKVDDVSEAAGDTQLAWRRATVEDLKRTFDYAKLAARGEDPPTTSGSTRSNGPRRRSRSAAATTCSRRWTVRRRTCRSP